MSGKKIFLILFPVFICAQLLSGCVGINSEGVKTLRDMSQDEKSKEEHLAEENQNFENIKSAVLRQKLKAGLPADEVVGHYGEPVTVRSKDEGAKWVYKEKDSGWFSGPKIYLYFDKNNLLKRWKCIRTDCGASN